MVSNYFLSKAIVIKTDICAVSGLVKFSELIDYPSTSQSRNGREFNGSEKTSKSCLSNELIDQVHLML